MCDVPFSDKNHFDVDFDLIESLLTQDTLIIYSPKIDFLLEEFASELVHIDLMPPGTDETDFDPKDDIRFIKQLLYDDTLSEDDSFKDIDYVEASPLDSELVSLEEVKDNILREKLMNINILIAKIESLNNNPTPDCVLKSPSSSCLSYLDNSLPKFKTFSDHTEETSSGSTTTYADNSLSESDLEVSFPSRTKNKIFDPGIFFEVQSKRFLSQDTFSAAYMSLPFEDRHYLSFTYVIRTFLPYFTYPMKSPFLLSFESEDIIFDPGISIFHFSSLEPVAFKCLMEVFSSTCFVPNITMISGESC
nr:hypothetical protein [Tanacetum cinerariifolium]